MVNEKPITKATLKDGDKVVLPNVILQLVYVIEKKTVIKKKVLKDGGGEEDLYDDLDQAEPVPQSLLGKPIWFFKNKVMPIKGIARRIWDFLLSIIPDNQISG